MSTLKQYSSNKIRHPSWRVYRALEEIRKDPLVSSEDKLELDISEFSLMPIENVYIPYKDIDMLTQCLIDALKTDNYENDRLPIVDTLTLFLDVEGRQHIEALLMTGMTPFDIAEETTYSMDFIQTYVGLFFDTSVWRTPSDRKHYIEDGTEGIDRIIKRDVVTKGIDYVKTKVFHVTSKIKLEQAMLNLFAENYKQTMHYISIGTKEDQEIAQGWAKLTIATYRELKNTNQSDGGIRELTIALQASPAPSLSVGDLKEENKLG